MNKRFDWSKENFRTQLHLACGNGEENYRKVFEYVHFKDGYAIACDARILAKQSLDYCGVIDKENLNGKMIHRDTFKNILKYNRVVATPDNLECYDKSGGKTTFAYGTFEGTLPDFDRVIADFKEPSETKSMLVNPKQLDIAQKCLYCYKDYVKMTFYQRVSCNPAVIIESADPDYVNQFVLVMLPIY